MSQETVPGDPSNEVSALPDYEITQYFPRKELFSSQEKQQLREDFGYIRTAFVTRPDRFRQLQRWLNQGRFGVMYDEYLSRVTYYSIGAGVVGLLAGLLVGYALASAGVLAGIGLPESFPAVAPLLALAEFVSANREVVAITVLSAVGFALFAGVTWGSLYYYPKTVVDARERNINVFLPHAIVYMYALSRGGRNIFEVFQEMADADDVYGSVAEEFDAIVRDVELFGNDLFTAIRNARNRTPSDGLEQFLDDLLNVLDSGSDVPAFFEGESERYMQEAREEQNNFIDKLEILSEVFVVGFVAAPLFVMVTLMVISLLGGQTIVTMYAMVYAILPLGMLGFYLLIDYLSQPFMTSADELQIDDEMEGRETLAHKRDRELASDFFALLVARLRGLVSGEDGAEDDEYRMESDPRFRAFRRRHHIDRLLITLQNPIERIRRHNALYSLVLTAPIAVIALGVLIATGAITPSIEAYNEAPVQMTIRSGVLPFFIVAVPLSFLYELRRHREKHLEERFPDVLNILSSANQMGIPLTEALMLVSQWSEGRMAEELRRLRNDITWTYDVKRSLIRFANRIYVTQITQTIKLIAEGSQSSSDLSKVLSVAAEDTRSRYRLARKRRREMNAYIAIVVIGYLVFLAVVVLLDTSYLDPIAQLPSTSGQASTGGRTLAVGSVPVQAYRTLFFHSALLQGLGTGLLAGKLSDNTALNGLKYSIVLVTIAVLVFVLL